MVERWNKWGFHFITDAIFCKWVKEYTHDLEKKFVGELGYGHIIAKEKKRKKKEYNEIIKIIFLGINQHLYVP